jgi:hypothetical protein
MRKLAFAGGAAALALLVAAVPVLAGGGQRGGRIDRQTFVWTNDEASTSSTEWEDMPGLDGLSPPNCFTGSNAVTAQASLNLDRGGAPADVRVGMQALSLVDQRKPMRPGAVSLEGGSPLDGPEAFSFTFVHPNPPSVHGTVFHVQWRSPSGAEITMRKGTLTVLWDFKKGLCL